MEIKDGFCYTRYKIDHALVRPYKKRYRFRTQPEIVWRLLQDVPELREYFDYDFYRAWINSLRNIESIKNAREFSFGDYEFKLKPFDHQKRAIYFVRSLPACGLFMETGTGKTYVALVSTEMRLQKGLAKKALAIAPASILRSSWHEDCKKFTNLKAIIAHSDRRWPWYCQECGKRYYSLDDANRHLEKEGHKGEPHPELDWYKYKSLQDRIYDNNYDLYITSPQLATIYKDDFINAGFDLVILDESTMIKNPTGKMSQAIREIGHRAKFRLALTGTPMAGGLEDIWSQMQFVDMCLDDTIGQFRSRYFWQHPQYHYIRNPQPGAGEKVMDRIKDRCLFIKKDDCLDLPDRLRIVREIEPTAKTKKIYNDFKKDLYVRLENHEVSTDNRLVEALRLHQILHGFVTKPDGSREVIEKKPPKIQELETILGEVDGKVIVWIYYRHCAWAIQHHLKQYKPAIATGRTTDIDAEVAKFRDDPDCRIIIAHPASVKFGHTWNWSTTSVYYSYGYSLENYLQSRDRNYRVGQDKPVTEIVLTSGGIDTAILESLTEGKEFSDEMMNMIRVGKFEL